MTTAITVAGPAGLASAANEDVKAGLAKYMKRKRLDSIDTYIPPLLEARDQLIRIERIMIQDPKTARNMLRSGSFAGVRESVRAVEEYAASNGQQDGVGRKFLQELEKLDYTLLGATRGEVIEASVLRDLLHKTLAVLNLLLEKLSPAVVSRASNVMRAAAENSSGGSIDPEEVKRLSNLL